MSTPALPTRPLWQRLLLRRLKFLAGLAGLLLVAVGGSYWLAPQWLMQLDQARQAMVAHVDKQGVLQKVELAAGLEDASSFIKQQQQEQQSQGMQSGSRGGSGGPPR